MARTRVNVIWHILDTSSCCVKCHKTVSIAWHLRQVPASAAPAVFCRNTIIESML